MVKSIIYYTDNKIEDPIKSVVRQTIKDVELPIISVSLKPINFGKNIVVNRKRGYITMVYQILTALRNVNTKYVFFCEHDVLYPKSHFEFTPPTDNIFYYNSNVWRWYFGSDICIRYDRMLPLSSLSVSTRLALKNYELRWRKIKQFGSQKFEGREPKQARIWGYEPGTKKKRRGGITNDSFNVWQSKVPVIDIRHKGTFSPPKITLDSFKHRPANWQEISIDQIDGWNLRSICQKT